MNRKLLLIITGMILAIVIAVMAYIALSGSDQSGSIEEQPQNIPFGTIVYLNTGFDPISIDVDQGQIVTFTNSSDTSLWVIAGGATAKTLPDLNSKQGIGLSESYSYTFEKAGTYTVTNKLNPEFKATIQVN